MSLYRLLRPALFRLDAERAHRLALRALASGAVPPAPDADRRLRQTVMGLDFPNPIGLAAGFDKNAEVPDAAMRAGFGFAEVGTVTPRPQAGNPRPRVFRLAEEEALINRLGFNNDGFDAAAARLEARRRSASNRGPVGVNIGANRDAVDRVADYAAGVARFAPLADYLAINVSSPNTPGLRDLQAGGALRTLLSSVAAARERTGRRPPVLVKIAPDIESRDDLVAIVEGVRAAGLDGLIVGNTTVARDGVSGPHAAETGGLSGRPLFDRSTALLAEARAIAGPEMALIGVGGVDSADAAFEKLAAGADLVQLYTGMVFAGPRLARTITAGLAGRLAAAGVPGIGDVVGTGNDAWRERCRLGGV